MANWKVPVRSMPCPPGQSPFRVKGHGLRARLSVYDQIVPGGSAAVLAAIEDPEVRGYLSGPILHASWYDLFAHAVLDLAAADLRQMPASESVASASAIQAHADARGVYALLLRLASPHMVVRKLGAIASQYFDHGTIEVERLEVTAARMTRIGIANQLYWWWSGILEGYVRALFGIAGAKDLSIYCGVLQTESPADPLGLGRFSVEIRWA